MGFSPLVRPAAACLLLLTAACAADAPATAPSTRKDDRVKIALGKTTLTLELADTPAKHELGLMNRASMAADDGMLFVFDTPGYYAFWMKNTLIGLDIIYLDAAGTVVDIHTRKPFDETGIPPAAPAQFVIELNAHRAAAIGLARGSKVAIPEKYLKAAPASPEKKQ